MAMRNIVPVSYKLGTGAECVRRVARWLDGRRYIYGIEKINGSVRPLTLLIHILLNLS